LNWNNWIRKIHRWLSITFTAAVIINLAALMQKEQVVWIGLMALFPLVLLLFSGLYLFALPYAARWRSGEMSSSPHRHSDPLRPHGGWRAILRRPAREKDHFDAAGQVLEWDRADNRRHSTVGGVVAVVAEHEVLSCRHDKE